MEKSTFVTEPPGEVPDNPKRRAIVEAATRLFLGEGFGAVSVDTIAAEANVSKRTVYSHFENKGSLFAGVMTCVCEQRGGVVGCPLLNGDLVRKTAVADILQMTGEHLLGIITSPQAIEVYRVVIGETSRFPELGKNFFDCGPSFVLKMISDYLSDRVAAGELTIDEPDIAARHLMAMMVFPLQMELACGVRDSISEPEIRVIVAKAVGSFMKAYVIS